MKQDDLKRSELEGLHSVLRRACERAEHKCGRGNAKDDEEADRLAAAVADLADELAGVG